ncbi:hypothetical protein [Hymenobacter sp. IS2118]|uniref:hypothetical protein n=1 Tax=Hymenobacter sp. IS2118 TaxID=1505605 RepID=UPI00055228B3|nr:hypothetical protein [Hymenobacter sp. IS2118]
MIFSITPHVGARELQFGMNRTAIRAHLAETPERFFRGEAEDTDFYAFLGLFALYNAAETCVALEFTRPARVLIGEVSLLSLSKKKALALFEADPALEHDGAGYTCYQQGIGAYYEASQRAGSVIAFSPDCYSS